MVKNPNARRKRRQAARERKRKQFAATKEYFKKQVEEELEHSKLPDEAKVIDNPGRYRKRDFSS